MKTTLMAVAALAAVLNGCEWSQHAPVTQASAPEAKLVESINDTAVRDGILRQCTIFPYHFEPGAPDLNGLGQSTVAVLADRFRKYPGAVSVRRGDAPVELYRQRVQRVLAAMEKAGVPRTGMRVTDSPSVGDGLPGEQVLTILRTPAIVPASSSDSSGTSGTGAQK